MASHFKARKLQKNNIAFFFSTEKVPQGFDRQVFYSLRFYCFMVFVNRKTVSVLAGFHLKEKTLTTLFFQKKKGKKRKLSIKWKDAKKQGR
ncbi:MAG: hypothetical protein H0X63_06345 [Flavobacteriales bacterium]|nr:hypothetical protein [Flavobacteriales bacterium]